MGPTPCPATSALAALYRNTHESGNSWSGTGSQLNWMEGDPCEEATSQNDNSGNPVARTGGWTSVTCDSNSQVREVNLADQSVQKLWIY